ncbi:hypothetical protein [Neisseria bacilliformis]|uniref:hypothetical protein n=1 Tax=Neisseria bacilliformis TaxID=267212 RepID=UPI0028EA6497|nr:hypothetical protein [Neisseria bacilliformis]
MADYGLAVDGRPPFSGVAMLVETLHIADGNGEYVYPSDDERYGYFATSVYSDNHWGHTSLRVGSGGGKVSCTWMADTGDKVRWSTSVVNAYDAYGHVDTLLIWRYRK